MTEFTPVQSLLGGLLVGLAVVLFAAGCGRVAGISGIVVRLLPPPADSGSIRVSLAFIAGLLAAAPLYRAATGEIPAITVTHSPLLLACAGLLVGLGSVLGNGCTSGHGVCGLSRLSRRSVVATASFMASAMVTVFVLRHVMGGTP